MKSRHRTALAAVMAAALAVPALAQDIPELPELPDLEPLPVPEFVLPPQPAPPPAVVLEPDPPDRGAPTDLYGSEAADVASIERLAVTSKEDARTRALDTRARLAAERDSQRALETQHQGRADEWEELAAAADADATRNRERAAQRRQDLRAPGLTGEERAELERQAEFWDAQAEGDSRRAADRRANAASAIVEAERARDRIAFLDELIARLDRVIEETGEEEQAAGTADAGAAQPGPGETGERAAPDYEMTLEQALGIWRPDDAPDRLMVIVEKTPDSGSRALELHTADRVWTGEYHYLGQDERATEPRLTFEYTPAADEMNPEIPAQARAAVEGRLVWRIEAFETGSAAEPELSFNFFRGRVTWQDQEPADAEVDGDGPPKVFTARKDAVLAARIATPTQLFVRIANQRHDPSLRNIEAATRGMPLNVNVVMGSASAREAGSTISVDITSPSGGSTSLSLTRQAVKDGRVIYGHTGAVTIGGDAPLREFSAYSAPPRRIYGWVISALGLGEIEPGPRLNVFPDSGDTVEFRYQDAYHRFPVYASWVQNALAQYDAQIDTMAAAYGGILASGADEAAKAATRDRLRMLANYQVLRRSPDLTDLHRLAIAEAYLGRPHGRQLLAFGRAELDRIQATTRRGDISLGEPAIVSPGTWLSICGGMSSVGYARTLEAPDLGGRAATGEEVGDALQRNALAFLGHTGINAATALTDADLDWVHPLERDCLDRAIVRVSRGLLERSLKDYGTSLAFGLYEGIAMATGAEDLAIAFFETDLYGNKVPQYSVPWWISTLSVAFEASSLAGEAIDMGRRSIDPDIWKAAARNVPDGTSWSRKLGGDAAARISRRIPVTDGVGDAHRTMIRRADGSVEEIAERAEDALAALPDTLSAQQRRQTYIDMVPPEEVDGIVPDGATPRYSDRIPGSEALGASNPQARVAGGQQPSARNPETGVIHWYGKDAKPLGDLGPEFCQIGSEHGCEGVSAAYMLFKEEGTLFDEAMMHFEMMKVYVQRRKRQGMSWQAAYDEFVENLYGVDRGYKAKEVAYMLRSRGYEVKALNPRRQGAYSLAHIDNAIQNGWRVRLGIRKPGQTRGGHAVVVESVVRGFKGRIEEVVFFCPTQGGLLKMKADRFTQWMIRDMDYDVVYAMRKRQGGS